MKKLIKCGAAKENSIKMSWILGIVEKSTNNNKTSETAKNEAKSNANVARNPLFV